jgi:hypothetical protein
MLMTSRERMLELAQGQLEAYNQRDLEKFCLNYHPDVTAYRLATGDVICQGMPAFREVYKSRFDSSPRLHCELKSRIVLNDSILDEEWVTGVEGASAPSHVVAIYAFEDGLISKVWFAR